MHTLRSLPAAIACLAALSFTTPASATLTWNWSFDTADGLEAGTFTTDGASYTPGTTFTITDFSVTSSAFVPGGSIFTQALPTQGFVWDGSIATQFFRDSGALTDGAMFDRGVFSYIFLAGGANQTATLQNNDAFGPDVYSPLTLGHPAAAVPAPATLSLFAIGVAGLAARRRLKAV